MSSPFTEKFIADLQDLEEKFRAILKKDGLGDRLNEHFILENGEVKEVDLAKWAYWLECHPKERIIKQQYTWHGYFVSTVFLGLNHNYGGGPPLIFETMVLDTRFEYQWRGSTLDQAKAHHEKVYRIAQIHPFFLRWFA